MITLDEMLKNDDIETRKQFDRPLPTLLFGSDWDQGFAININPNNLDNVIAICEKLKLAARNKNLPQIDYSHETYYTGNRFSKVKRCLFRVALPPCNLGPYRVVCRMDYKDSVINKIDSGSPEEKVTFVPYLYSQKGFPFEAIPESIRNGTCPPNCDHCEQNRARNVTYLVFNTADESFKQIGSSCVEQFTGIDHAASQLNYFALLENLNEAIIDYEENYDYDYDKDEVNKFAEWVPLADVLAITQAVVTNDGRYISKDTAAIERIEPTADAVLHIIEGGKRIPDIDYDKALKNSETIKQEVLLACKSMRNREYAHNLATALSSEMVSIRKLGVACSAVAVWYRDVVSAKENAEKVKRAQQAIKNSTEAGLSAGDRVEKLLKVNRIQDFYSGSFPTSMVLMTDDKNFEYKWSASAPPRNTAPDVFYKAKLTIKGFEEYKGIPQRVVTRVTFPDLDAVDEITQSIRAVLYSKDAMDKGIKKLSNFTVPLIAKGGAVQNWVNQSMFYTVTPQAMHDFLTNSKVMTNWKELSQQYAVNDDKVSRPSIHAAVLSLAVQTQIYGQNNGKEINKINGEDAFETLIKLSQQMNEAGVFYMHKFNADGKSIVPKVDLKPFIASLLGEHGADSNYLAWSGKTEEIKLAYETLKHIFDEVGKTIVLPDLLTKDFSYMDEPIIGMGQTTGRLFVYDRSFNNRLEQDHSVRFKEVAFFDASGEPYYATGSHIRRLNYDRLQSLADGALLHGYPSDYTAGFELDRKFKNMEESIEGVKKDGLSNA